MYVQSTPSELKNDMLHDAECELHQKLLIADVFPGILIIGNIFVTINATKVKRYFFGPTL